MRERQGEIVLIPIKKYKALTQSLLGSVKVTSPIDDPKGLAREHAARKALEAIE